MKRAINFLAVLMLAFVVTFGFVVNTASAATITCPDKLSQLKPCSMSVNTGDLLALSYSNGATLSVILVNSNPIATGQIVPTIGSQTQQQLYLQPSGILSTTFPTNGSDTATFANQSDTKNTEVFITITSSI